MSEVTVVEEGGVQVVEITADVSSQVVEIVAQGPQGKKGDTGEMNPLIPVYLAEAKQARNEAVAAKNTSEVHASNASVSAGAAKASETAAAGSEAVAAAKAEAAKKSETESIVAAAASGTSARAAAGSAGAADASATAAYDAETAAAASAATANTRANAASTSATNAAASETAAGKSAVSAKSSADAAKTSETKAAASETKAAASETNAAKSATAAAGSATTATTKALDAGKSASTATGKAADAATSAGQAASSAASAGASATAAAASAGTAGTKASDATTSATAAAASAKTASDKATAASTSAANAEGSAASASTNAVNSGNSARAAEASAKAAAASAKEAQNSATTAGAKATEAVTSAGNALDSKNAAKESETKAASSAASLAAALAQYREQYLGSFDDDPTVDGNGNPIREGAEYFNTVTDKLRVYVLPGGWQDADESAQAATQNALNSAAAAAASATAAAASATAATAKAAAAQASAGDAADSAGAAESHVAQAASSASTAKTHADGAAASATAAANSASQAASSKTAAAASAVEAAASAAAARTHAGDVGNPHKVTKAQVGLGNVDNTSDADKPVSRATQAALDAKAPKDSPTFTGPVTASKFVGDLEGVAANAAQLQGVPGHHFIYGDNSSGTINTTPGDGGIGANNLARSGFFRDNGGNFGSLGINIVHPHGLGHYALQIASTTYDNGELLFRFQSEQKWQAPKTLVSSTNVGSYAIDLVSNQTVVGEKTFTQSIKTHANFIIKGGMNPTHDYGILMDVNGAFNISRLKKDGVWDWSLVQLSDKGDMILGGMLSTGKGIITSDSIRIAGAGQLQVGTGEAGVKTLHFVNDKRHLFFHLQPDGNAFGLWDQNKGINRFVSDSDGNFTIGGYSCARIFVASNDGNYYCDPTGHSRFTGVTLSTNVWSITSSDGAVRAYFTNNGPSVLRGGGAGWYHVFQDAAGADRSILEGAGNFYTTGNITAYWSDRRLKQKIATLRGGLEAVCRLRGVEFEWNGKGRKLHGKQRGEKEIGFIAQEVQEVIPGAVAENLLGKAKDGSHYLTVKKEMIVPHLVEAIKELAGAIRELAQSVRAVSARVKKLEQRFDTLKGKA